MLADDEMHAADERPAGRAGGKAVSAGMVEPGVEYEKQERSQKQSPQLHAFRSNWSMSTMC